MRDLRQPAELVDRDLRRDDIVTGVGSSGTQEQQAHRRHGTCQQQDAIAQIRRSHRIRRSHGQFLSGASSLMAGRKTHSRPRFINDRGASSSYLGAVSRSMPWSGRVPATSGKEDVQEGTMDAGIAATEELPRQGRTNCPGLSIMIRQFARRTLTVLLLLSLLLVVLRTKTGLRFPRPARWATSRTLPVRQAGHPSSGGSGQGLGR